MQLAKAIKAVVDIPVIGVNGIKSPEQAEAVLAHGVADLVAVVGALLADPLWASKALSGQADQISHCMGCKRCGHYRHPFACPARPGGLA
jgi:2,4-dienoyl-CoA reductase-like NADH-dependent reductase (Old Yellow Enzyme family)